MFGSELLEVVIGLAFVFTLVSLTCSTIRESIEGLLRTRAAYLEFGIRELLDDRRAAGLARSLYEHPLVASLYSGDYSPRANVTARRSPRSNVSAPRSRGTVVESPRILAVGRGLPSYIPSRNFALALMDIAARGPRSYEGNSDPHATPVSLDSIRANIRNIESPSVRRAVLTAVDTARGDIDRARENLQDWYDSAMDRVAGWYRRSTQWIIFWIGLAVAVGMNVNTITVADYLYRNDAARAALVARAESAARDTTLLNRDFDAARAALDSLSLPIGWSRGWGAPRHGSEPRASGAWNDGFAPVLGWLLTALAATLGAPFWFDLLNKLIVIRSTVKPREKSPEEASEDRQRRSTADGAASGQQPSSIASRPLRQPTTRAVHRRIVAPEADRWDDESDIDACAVLTTLEAVRDQTPDEQLPAPRGGVA